MGETRWSSIATWLALLVGSATAHAQDEHAAQLTFDRGAEHYHARELELAADAFAESYRLSPTPNVAFNLAQVHELLQRDEEAYNWWQRHLAFPIDQSQREHAEARIQHLSTRVAVLAVRVTPPEASLSIDGADAEGRGNRRRIAVPPGQRRLEARLAGYRPAVAIAEAVRGSATAVTLQLVANEATGPAALAPVTRADPSKAARPAPSLQHPIGQAGDGPQARTSGLGDLRWAGYGAAAVLAGVGIAVGVGALHTRDRVAKNPTPEGQDELTKQNLIADLTIGGALLTAATTLVLDLVLAPSEKVDARP